MEFEVSLPLSQNPAVGSYPTPLESNLHHHTIILYYQF